MIVGFAFVVTMSRMVWATSPSIRAPKAQKRMALMISPTVAHARKSSERSSSNSIRFKVFPQW